MQFLKILFWCLLAFLAAVFTVGNWNHVDIHLWNGITAAVNLPLLLVTMFLAGLVPTLVYHHAVRWRLRQRLQAAEQRAAIAVPAPAPHPAASPASAPFSPAPLHATPDRPDLLPASPVAPVPEAP